jgi:Arc/MetJ family transcription regulator
LCRLRIRERRCPVATNLAIDDALIEEARTVGGHKTKKEAVTAALREYVEHRRQAEVLELFGTVSFDPEYDYKAERKIPHYAAHLPIRLFVAEE